MLKRPKAILFDMGGVLSPPADAYSMETFPLSFPDGLPEPAHLDWFIGLSTECLETFLAMTPPRPALHCRPIIAKWLMALGEATDSATVARWQRVLEQWEARPVFPHVPPTLAALQKMGFHMGVVSNTVSAADYLREHFGREGILDYFEFTVFSAEFGVNKPDPRLFQHALDSMEIDASDAWYVGDKPQRDICGAHRAGMTAVLVDGPHARRVNDAPENEPDLRVQDISALPGVLEDL